MIIALIIIACIASVTVCISACILSGIVSQEEENHDSNI